MFSAHDSALLDDPKYRNYISAIDKALKNFESSSEWADLISALGKLHKVLNPKYKVIPKSITVGKRLAQCMHPALPGGVHLKALQVYDCIFNIITKQYLQTDLYIYSTGIFPLLSNASMQVRPVLLNLYETHILPLGKSIITCLDGIVVGLLPGLEEGTEYFDRVDVILKKLCGNVGHLEFYSAIWRSILCSSSARLPAIQLVLRRFDKRRTTDDQLYIIGSDINVMVRALCESFQDASVLVQRASFDVLISICPLSSIPVSKEDCCSLLIAAVQCILRRDMSLNRRLYSWLLGFDQSKRHESSTSIEQDQSTFFEKHSKELLIKACKYILDKQKCHIKSTWKSSNFVSADDLYPLKLLVNLLDKAEIGPLIIDELLIDVFRLLQAAMSCLKVIGVESGKDSAFTEVTKTVNLLLDVFEPGYIWRHIIKLLSTILANLSVEKAQNSHEIVTFVDICDFIQLFLEIVSLENFPDVRTSYLPEVLFHVIDYLIKSSLSEKCTPNLNCGLTASSKLLDSCQSSQPEEYLTMHSSTVQQTNPTSADKDEDELNKHSVSDCSQHFNEFVCTFVSLFLRGTRCNIDKYLGQLEIFQAVRDKGMNLPIDSQNLNENSQSSIKQIANKSDDSLNNPDTVENLLNVFHLLCRLLLDFACFPVYYRGPASPTHNTNTESVCFPAWFKSLLFVSCWDSADHIHWFKFSSCAISTILDLISLSQSVYLSAERPDDEKALGTVSVAVLSPLSSMHTEMLYDETSFFQLISKDLWKMIGNESDWHHHLTCVHLLVRLHSMCTDARCEDVLLEDILHHDQAIRTNSIMKFCRLWHFTRILTRKKFGQNLDGHFYTFSRCLFAVVDTLAFSESQAAHPSSPLFQLTEGNSSVAITTVHRWLRQCLEKQDLLRVLEPFLLVILHPKTRSSPLYAETALIKRSAESSNNSEFIPQEAISEHHSSKLKVDFRRLTLKDGKPTSTSAVIAEIARGKSQYRELVSKLTACTESELIAKAHQIVDQVIKDSLHYLQTTTFAKTCEEKGKISTEQVDSGKSQRKISHDVKNHKIASHSNILLYKESFDTHRVLYALRSILSLFECDPRLFTYTASTTQMSSHTSYLTGQSAIQELLVRHQQSMSGNQFYGDISTRSPSIMIIDVLIGICLRYIRSWHPPTNHLPHFLHDVRCVSCKLLLALLNQMSSLTKDSLAASPAHMTSSPATSSSQQFSAFVLSILSKHHVQETALLALSHTVQALHAQETNVESPIDFLGISGRSIPSLSDTELGYWWCGNNRSFIVSFQANLLHLVRSIIAFEHRCTEIDPTRFREAPTSPQPEENRRGYLSNLPLSKQPALLNSIIKVLRLQSARELHSDWLDFVTSSLPHMSRALPTMLTPLTLQICRNLENAANCYVTSNTKVPSGEGGFPVDYVTSLLQSLRTLTHSSLLLPASGASSLVIAGLTNPSDRKPSLVATANPAQASQTSTSLGFSALGSLFNVFSSNNTLRPQHSVDDHELTEEAAEAKRISLNNLSRVLSCLASIWNKSTKTYPSSIQNLIAPPGVQTTVTMGDEDSVSQGVLQLLNPIALQYGENLFNALAIIWERRGRSAMKRKHTNLRQPNDQQLQLVDVTCSIRALHCDVVLGLVKRVVTLPPDYPALSGNTKRQTPNEECLLNFVLRYIQRQTPSVLRDSRSSMLTLVRECLAQGPPGANLATNEVATSGNTAAPPTGRRQLGANCHFLLLQLVAEYARSAHNSEDKKELKEMQEVTIKCIESCNAIVDSSLEHGGWLARKAPTVLPASQHEVQHHLTESGSSVDLLDPHPEKEDSALKLASSDPILSGRKSPNQQPQPSMTLLPQKANPNYEHSVNALRMLAQHLANLLDLVFGSEEKDKMIPILTAVMTNTTPYLRNHSMNFAPSYRAAVSLLSSVSGFQQTRRSWKRDAFELFLGAGFFKMPPEGAHEWMNVVDHLMTHDATTFKDLMVRIGLTRNTTTGTSLNIFSNKEQELEQRAMLLKRLAFVVFSSGVNQYQRHLPEIQERLSESLRLHLVPAVQAEVFLCFRVMLVRLSPQHLTSLWPTIITELIQVLGQMEQELTLHDFDRDINNHKESSSKDRASLASSRVGVLFSTPTSSSSRMYLQEKWMAMYLSACKLLDLALVLQPNQLNYFKMFRWSFVGESGETPDDENLSNDNVKDRKFDESRNPSKADKSKSKTKQTIPTVFVPHCIRINRLLSSKVATNTTLLEAAPLRPLLTMQKLKSLFDLRAFFNTITSSDIMLRILPNKRSTTPNPEAGLGTLSSPYIEDVLRNDFVEEML
uniref:Protein dopey-1 n=1 Tax=Phallusia mammillata TaxID=59560 RepID=A0A6F9DBV2_9ASCI|nr:protein dopey-1 [Phallusia mammillata]